MADTGDTSTYVRALAERIENADAINLVELPESGTRRDHNRLTTRDEVLIVEALRSYAAR